MFISNLESILHLKRAISDRNGIKSNRIKRPRTIQDGENVVVVTTVAVVTIGLLVIPSVVGGQVDAFVIERKSVLNPKYWQ